MGAGAPSGAWDSGNAESSDALMKTLLLGVAIAIAAGVVLAAGGALWLAAAFLCVIVVVLTAGRPEYAVSTMIFALPLFGGTTVLSAPGIPDVTVSRMLVLWSVVVVGSAIESQRRQLGPPSGEAPGHDPMLGSLPVWVGVFLGFMLLAGFRSPSLRTGLQGWLDDYCLPFVLLLVFSRYRWSRRQIDLVVAVYLACCCLWSALALAEFVTKRSLFTADGTLPWASGGAAFGRTGGPFINPAFLGTAVGIGLVLAWVWAGRSGIPRRVALVCGPMSAAGLTVSLTRASWLGAAAGVLLLLALTRRHRVATTVITLSALAIGVVLVASLLGAGFLETRTASKSEVFNRLVAQRAAVRIVADNPLFGVGSNRFSMLSRQNLSNVGTISAAYGLGVSVPHNSILGAMVDGGLGAGACLVVVFGLLLASGRRRVANPSMRYLGVAALACTVVLAVNAMFVDMSLAFAVTTLALSVIGIFLSTPNEQRLAVQ